MTEGWEEEKEGKGGIKTKVQDNVSGSYYFYLKLCTKLHKFRKIGEREERESAKVFHRKK